MNSKETVFHIYLPDELIKVLRVKMVEDKKLEVPLPPGQLMFVGAIIGLSNERGYCYAKPKRLAELTTLPNKTIKYYLTFLEKEGILYRHYVHGERRIRISNELIEAYPELTKCLNKKTVDGANSPTDGANSPTDGANSPTDGANSPTDGANSPTSTYYIYKIKESILKRKLKEKKEDFLFSVSQEELSNYIDDQPQLTNQQLEDDAFNIICSYYPVQTNVKKAKECFGKLNAQDLQELFESLGEFRIVAKAQKEENLSANQTENKFIPHLKSYIEQKRYVDYLKNSNKEGAEEEGDTLGLFKARIRGYAIAYGFSKRFEAKEIDRKKDFKYLIQIVQSVYHNGIDENTEKHCQLLFEKDVA